MFSRTRLRDWNRVSRINSLLPTILLFFLFSELFQYIMADIHSIFVLGDMPDVAGGGNSKQQALGGSIRQQEAAAVEASGGQQAAVVDRTASGGNKDSTPWRGSGARPH